MSQQLSIQGHFWRRNASVKGVFLVSRARGVALDDASVRARCACDSWIAFDVHFDDSETLPPARARGCCCGFYQTRWKPCRSCELMSLRRVMRGAEQIALLCRQRVNTIRQPRREQSGSRATVTHGQIGVRRFFSFLDLLHPPDKARRCRCSRRRKPCRNTSDRS